MDTMYIRCKIINEEAKSQYEIVGNRVRDNRGKAYGEAFEKWKDDLKSAFVLVHTQELSFQILKIV